MLGVSSISSSVLVVIPNEVMNLLDMFQLMEDAEMNSA